MTSQIFSWFISDVLIIPETQKSRKTNDLYNRWPLLLVDGHSSREIPSMLRNYGIGQSKNNELHKLINHPINTAMKENRKAGKWESGRDRPRQSKVLLFVFFPIMVYLMRVLLIISLILVASSLSMPPKIFSESSAVAIKNVLGSALKCCCTSPKTGFYRDGFCKTGPQDTGSHTVCAIVTSDFLDFSKSVGNDLSTPRPEYNFPGLKDGDKWCLCASRWLQAAQAGHAPKVILERSHEKSLEIIPQEILFQHQFNPENTTEIPTNNKEN